MQSQASDSLAIVLLISATARSGEIPRGFWMYFCQRFRAPCSPATRQLDKTIPGNQDFAL